MTNTLPGEWTQRCQVLPGRASPEIEDRIRDLIRMDRMEREDVLRWLFRELDRAGVTIP